MSARLFVDVPAAAGNATYAERATGYVVILSGLWHAVPIFHRLDWRGAGGSTTTRCGVDAMTRGDDGWRALGEWLPLRHAVRFGRPCRRCWP